jgi:hypothetical protein
MAGFREFVTGEVLTAANVDDFLAKQAVMKFADAAARDSALGTAVADGNALREGMVAYLDDTNDVLKYDGTSWSSVGGLVAVKHALFTGTMAQGGILTRANFAVTDLSITHTLADAANKLIISAFIGAAGNSAGSAQVGIAVADDGTLIGIGDADGNRTRVGAGGLSAPDILGVASPSVTFVYEPGDTASHVYTVRALNVDESTRTVYINRSSDDRNDGRSSRSSSGFVIQEVRV